MKKIVFNYVRCQNSDVLGLIQSGVNSKYAHAATEGRLIAHDVIEHNGVDTVGGIGHELEALGAIWWVRGEFNDLNRDMMDIHNPYESLAHDVCHMWISLANFNREYDIPVPHTYACVYDEDFTIIMEHARKLIMSEMRHMDIKVVRANRSKLKSYLSDSINFMRKGYRNARGRFRRLSQCGVNSLYWNIADAVDTVLEMLEYEGQQVELFYSLTTAEARVKVIEPNYY